MPIDRIPNRNSPPAYLLRETWREDGKVRKRTLANLSALPAAKIEGIRRILKGDQPVFDASELEVLSARDHGGVSAVVQVMKDLGLPRRLGRKKTRQRPILQALIAARVLAPQSKLAAPSRPGHSGLCPRRWVSRMSPLRRPTKPWMPCWATRSASRTSWPRSACKRAPWCCMT